MKIIRITAGSIALLIGLLLFPHPNTPNAYGQRNPWYPCRDGTWTYKSLSDAQQTPQLDGCENHGGYASTRPFYFPTPPPNPHGKDPFIVRFFMRFEEHFELDQTNHSDVEEFLNKNKEIYAGNLEHRFTIPADISRGIQSMNNVFIVWSRSEYVPLVAHSFDESTMRIQSIYPLTLLDKPVYLGTDSYIYFIPKNIIPKAPDGMVNISCECCYKSAYWWFYAFAYSSTIFNVTMDGQEGVLLYARPASKPDTSSTPALK